MTEFRFNFNQADHTLDDMEAVNRQTTDLLTRLRSEVDSTLSEWTSEVAKTEYETSKRIWDQSLAAMSAQLQAGRQALFNVTESYGTSEQRGAQIWNNR